MLVRRTLAPALAVFACSLVFAEEPAKLNPCPALEAAGPTVAEQVRAEMAADCAKAAKKADAKAAKGATTVWPTGSWSIPVTAGYLFAPDGSALPDVAFASVGGEYRFPSNKLGLAVGLMAARFDDLDVPSGCCGCAPYHEGSQTAYGPTVTLTIPLR